MPRNYWGEAKTKFPLPSYPKEDAFKDSTKYKVAVNGFGMDCQQVLAEHSTWVNCKTITNLAHKSEAAHARAVDDKKHHEAEEEKKHWEMGEHPRKRGWVDTAGLTLAELSTSGVKKALWVCMYCAKRGELFLLLYFIFLFFELPL